MLKHDQRNHEYAVEPEMAFLQQFQWEGMITIRFEAAGWKANTDSGRSRRKHFVRALMNNLRAKWKVRDSDIYWVAATEWGASGAAHYHVIFSFLNLVSKGVEAADLTDFDQVLEESISYICKDQAVPARSIDFRWSPKYDDIGLVNYVCKTEPGYDYKDFEWSDNGSKWHVAFVEELDAFLARAEEEAPL